jgi:hypothetical protein
MRIALISRSQVIHESRPVHEEASFYLRPTLEFAAFRSHNSDASAWFDTMTAEPNLINLGHETHFDLNAIAF